MPDNAQPLPDRGKTWFDGTTPPTTFSETVDLEGRLRNFDNTDSATGVNAAQSKHTGRQVVARFVRNVSGITLEAKRIVKYATGHIGKRIDGYGTVNDERCAGVVDDHYATGILNNDLGWIIVQGPCLVKTDLASGANNVISQGDVMLALTAATSQATTAGRMYAWAGTFNVTSDVTTGRIANVAMNRIGQALTARTTANTNTDTLIDLELLKTVS